MGITYYLYRHIRLDKNEPFYIGVGHIDLEKSSYYKRAHSKVHRNTYWKNIVKSTNYIVEIIYQTDSKEIAFRKEIEFISLYGRKDLGLGTLCNMTNGGEGTTCHNKEWTLNQSKRMQGNSRRKDIPHSEDIKIKITQAVKDFYKTSKGIEERKRRSERAKIANKKGRPSNKIKVMQLDLDGTVIKIWDSSKEAAEELKTHSTSITKCCKQKCNTVKNYKWKYYEQK